jgi:hypothetical protein
MCVPGAGEWLETNGTPFRCLPCAQARILSSGRSQHAIQAPPKHAHIGTYHADVRAVAHHFNVHRTLAIRRYTSCQRIVGSC